MADWYKVQDSGEIEDFDPDQHGNKWYNVKLYEQDEEVMWLAKSQPEKDRQYYGHLEKTKSGKRWRFKRDQVPEGETAPSSSNRPQQAATGLQPDLKLIYAVVRDNNRLLKQLAGEEVKAAKDTFDTVADMDKDEEINLDDIPF